MAGFELSTEGPLGWTEILKRKGAARAPMLFVVSLASALPVQHLIDRIVTMLSRVAPGDVVAIARQQFVQITRQPHGGVLTLRRSAGDGPRLNISASIVSDWNERHR